MLDTLLRSGFPGLLLAEVLHLIDKAFMQVLTTPLWIAMYALLSICGLLAGLHLRRLKQRHS